MKFIKKYLGIIKIYDNYMSGTNIKIITKTYNEIDILNKWFNMYPESEYVLLENTKELDSIFKIFEDMTPITKEEQEEVEKAKILYKNLMND